MHIVTTTNRLWHRTIAGNHSDQNSRVHSFLFDRQVAMYPQKFWCVRRSFHLRRLQTAALWSRQLMHNTYLIIWTVRLIHGAARISLFVLYGSSMAQHVSHFLFCTARQMRPFDLDCLRAATVWSRELVHSDSLICKAFARHIVQHKSRQEHPAHLKITCTNLWLSMQPRDFYVYNISSTQRSHLLDDCIQNHETRNHEIATFRHFADDSLVTEIQTPSSNSVQILKHSYCTRSRNSDM